MICFASYREKAFRESKFRRPGLRPACERPRAGPLPSRTGGVEPLAGSSVWTRPPWLRSV